MDAIAIKHHYRAVDSVAKPRVHCVLSSLRLDFLPAEAAQTPGAAQRNTPRRVS